MLRPKIRLALPRSLRPRVLNHRLEFHLPTGKLFYLEQQFRSLFDTVGMLGLKLGEMVAQFLSARMVHARHSSRLKKSWNYTAHYQAFARHWPRLAESKTDLALTLTVQLEAGFDVRQPRHRKSLSWISI